MATTKYTGENALVYLITLVKNAFVSKVFKSGSTSEYKVLSDNDLTNTLKSNYDAAYNHSQVAHAPASAQANILDTVKVNGAIQTINNKAVDISVPLISTDIATDSGSNQKTASPKAVADYVTAALSGITGISFVILTAGEYDQNAIPTVTGNAGTIYLVPNSGSTNNNYDEYIWLNNTYEHIGTTEVDLSGYMLSSELVEFTNAEIDALWTSVT